MANKKNNSSGSWKKERASVDQKNKSRPKSNKYSSSDRSKRKDNAKQYWRAGYTRKDGTKVKGHYVKKRAH
jgi:hypothetical protein